MRYAIRSIKYLAALAIIYFGVMGAVYLSGYLSVTPLEALSMTIDSEDGLLKLSFLVILAAVQPLFGYIKREVEGDIDENFEQIVAALEASGFRLKGRADGELHFVANTIIKKIAFLFEDRVLIKQSGSKIEISGVRRGVAYAAYALDGFITNSRRGGDKKVENET